MVFFMVLQGEVTVKMHETIDLVMECVLTVPGGADEKRFEVG